MMEIVELPSEQPDAIDPFDPIKRLQRGDEASAGPSDASQLITPQTGFVIKTSDDTGRKVFINVCGAPEVDAPGDWTDEQIPEAAAKALEELNSPEGSPGNEALRFPLSLGQRQEDVDHTGALCYVFDAIFNIDVMQRASHTRRLKTFIIQLLLAHVAQKHNMALDPVNYKLPRMRYKGAGGPLPQHIRKAPRALVTEVAEDSAAAAAAADPQFALRFDKPRQQKSGQASQASAAASAMQAVPQRLKSAAPPLPPLQQQPLAQSPPLPASASQGLTYNVSFEGFPATSATIAVRSIALRGCLAKDIAISATSEVVAIRVQQQSVKVKLPFSVDSSASEGVLEPEEGKLRITVPFQSYSDYVQAEKLPAAIPAH